MKRVLPIIVVLVLVIVGATILYPMLRERSGDPKIDLGTDGAAVALATTTGEAESATDAATTTEAEATTAQTTPETESSNASEATSTSASERTQGDSSQSTEATTTSDAEQQTAPDFKVYDLDGNAVQYASLVDDKPVLLNFWASWCPPCREEMPDLQRLNDELGDEIEFILVNSTDGVRETPEKAKAFLEEHGFDLPVYLDQDGEASTIYGVRSLPTNILIGADGKIIGGIPGALTEAQFRELFETYLNVA